MSGDNSAGDPAAPLGGDTPASNPQPEPDSTTNNAGDAAASGGPVDPGQDQRQTEGEGDAAQPAKADDADPERPKREGGFQRRLREQQRQIEQLMGVVERLTGTQGQPKPTQDTAGEDGPPDPRDTAKYPLGEHDPRYISDHTVHRIRQDQHQERRRQRESEQATEITRAADAFHAKVAKLEDTIPGIRDSIEAARNNEFPMTDAMRFAIIESPKGPQVAHHLNHHRDEAARIARMSPIQAAREIGRLEATLPEAPTRRQTAAPAPPKEVAGAVSAIQTFDPQKFKGGDDEAAHANFSAWFAKQMKG